MNFFDSVFDFDGDGTVSPDEEILGFAMLREYMDQEEDDENPENEF